MTNVTKRPYSQKAPDPNTTRMLAASKAYLAAHGYGQDPWPRGTALTTAVEDGETRMIPASPVIAGGAVSVIGLASSPFIPGNPCDAQYAGLLTLTVEEWVQVALASTGSPGLRAGNNYFLSSDTPGCIINSLQDPATAIGRGVSTTTINLTIGAPYDATP